MRLELDFSGIFYQNLVKAWLFQQNVMDNGEKLKALGEKLNDSEKKLNVADSGDYLTP